MITVKCNLYQARCRVRRIFSETEITVIIRHPDKHISATCGQRRAPVVIRNLFGNRIELGIIINGEHHIRTCNRATRNIHRSDHNRIYRRIISCNIYRCNIFIAIKHLFWAIILTVSHSCIHQHSPRSRRVKPGKIKNRLRFTGSYKVPLAVGPYLDPGMIVVGMRPSWRIDLSRVEPPQ